MGRYERVPYPGTRPFEQSDQDIFFGRSEDASELAGLWLANSLTVAVGPVGSGKTSLLNAGVYPLVREESPEVLPPGRVLYGETFPSAALPEHNPYSLALLRSWSPWDSATRLVGQTVREFIHDQAERRKGVVLAAIDQIEVLLSDPGPPGTTVNVFWPSWPTRCAMNRVCTCCSWAVTRQQILSLGPWAAESGTR